MFGQGDVLPGVSPYLGAGEVRLSAALVACPYIGSGGVRGVEIPPVTAHVIIAVVIVEIIVEIINVVIISLTGHGQIIGLVIDRAPAVLLGILIWINTAEDKVLIQTVLVAFFVKAVVVRVVLSALDPF